MNEEKPTTFYFGRLHIKRTLQDFVASGTENWVKKRLLKYLNNIEVPVKVKDKDFKWYFGGISDEESFIIGKMGRVRKTKLRIFYDKSKRDFVEQITEDEDGVFSYFFIDVSKMIILFERRFIIGQLQFKKMFCDGFNIFYDQKDGLDIEFIKDDREIESILKSAEKIIKAKFNIRPTNPDMDEEVKIIDKELKKIKAKKGKLEFENKEDGLEVKEGTLLSSAIALCNRGYGDYTIDYFAEKQQRRLSSKLKTTVKSEKRPTNREEALKLAKKLINYAYKLLEGLK